MLADMPPPFVLSFHASFLPATCTWKKCEQLRRIVHTMADVPGYKQQLCSEDSCVCMQILDVPDLLQSNAPGQFRIITAASSKQYRLTHVTKPATLEDAWIKR